MNNDNAIAKEITTEGKFNVKQYDSLEDCKIKSDSGGNQLVIDRDKNKCTANTLVLKPDINLKDQGTNFVNNENAFSETKHYDIHLNNGVLENENQNVIKDTQPNKNKTNENLINTSKIEDSMFNNEMKTCKAVNNIETESEKMTITKLSSSQRESTNKNKNDFSYMQGKNMYLIYLILDFICNIYYHY